jgi:cytochrome oxidase Cu insertion factor (SCO1/SenC/PrrC family)
MVQMTTIDTDTTNKKRWRSRLKLIFIFSLFLGPLLGSFMWYYGLSAVMVPSGKSNHAPLVQPVVTLSQFGNGLHENGEVSLMSLKHKWTIVHIIGASCEQPCQKSLYNTRQTRFALGKDANRVQRFLILESKLLATKIRTEHLDVSLLKPSAGGISSQLKDILVKYNVGQNDGLLIDPLGNVMMIVPADLDPGKLLKDLKKLLKLSRIG